MKVLYGSYTAKGWEQAEIRSVKSPDYECKDNYYEVAHILIGFFHDGFGFYYKSDLKASRYGGKKSAYSILIVQYFSLHSERLKMPAYRGPE